MSFDIFLQRFERGDAADADGDLILEILRPYFAGPPQDGFVELRTSDGGADVHLSEPRRGLMVNHAGGEAVFEVLAQLAIRASLTIIPIGCPVFVPREAAIDDLPSELRRDVRVTRSGRELLEAIGRS